MNSVPHLCPRLYLKDNHIEERSGDTQNPTKRQQAHHTQTNVDFTVEYILPQLSVHTLENTPVSW